MFSLKLSRSLEAEAKVCIREKLYCVNRPQLEQSQNVSSTVNYFSTAFLQWSFRPVFVDVD